MQAGALYNARLTSGLGLIEETKSLLEIWQPGMDAVRLLEQSRSSGMFPEMSSRTVRNVVADAFAGRFLVDGARPAALLKLVHANGMSSPFRQLCFAFTCHAHRILADFVTLIYWPSYSRGQQVISNEKSLEFVRRANADGMTKSVWADSIQRRVASYLTGCLAEFGLLESGTRRSRAILPFRALSETTIALAYYLHLNGASDNAVLRHEWWAWYGFELSDVLFELRRWAKRNLLIVQSAGDAVRIEWPLKSMEEVIDAIA